MTAGAETFKVVVGIGFTDACKSAVTEAFALAARTPGTELHFATALEHADLARARQAAGAHERLIEAEKNLVDFVRVVAAQTEAHKQEVGVVYHVRVGPAVASLVQVAVDVDAGLIIVGTRARRGLAKLLLGSVAESLLAEARFPVLVARPRDVDGLTKTPRPEPRRPGEPLTSDRQEMLASAERVDYGSRRSHISGLL